MSEIGEIPLLDRTGDGEALLEPSKILKPSGIPEPVVVCFFQDVLDKLVKQGRLTQIGTLRSEIGDNPLFEADFNGQAVTVFHPGVGAPLAAAFLEEVIALGGRRFAACGGAGVLDSEREVGSVFVPYAAVRDEGTSFHYLPPSREVVIPPEFVASAGRVLDRHHCPHIVSKTWTTDAIYRETPARILLRRKEGCATVEMEAAAFFAVAEFRGVAFVQLLYGGDDVGSDQWDSRDWTRKTPVREKLFWLAVEVALEL